MLLYRIGYEKGLKCVATAYLYNLYLQSVLVVITLNRMRL